MNRETFIDLLDNKELLKNTASDDLYSIVNEFPYCQASRTLLTMSLYNEGHFKYDAELKTTALYVGDRRKLKEHIDNLSIAELEEKPALEDVRPIPEVAETEVTTEIEAESDIEPVETQDAPPLSFIEETKDHEELPEVVVPEETEVTKEEESAPVEVETQIEGVSDDQGETIETTGEEEQIDDKTVPQKIEQVEKPEEDRLSHLKSIVEARLKQIELDRRQIISEPEQAVKEEAKEQEESVDQLIDTFIQNAPSITRRQSAFFNPVDAAKDSVVDEENIVSETLANIYFDQKHYEKAINIYRKLSLIYPEKSIYFAAQIEKALEELKK